MLNKSESKFDERFPLFFTYQLIGLFASQTYTLFCLNGNKK